MYCTHCGKRLEQQANFCTDCGSAVDHLQAAGIEIAPEDNEPSEPGILKTEQLSLNRELDEDLMTFVDKNQDYYYRKWDLRNGKKKGITFNIAAFFLTIFWLGFRRMYLYVFIYSLFFLAIEYLSYLFTGIAGIGLVINSYLGTAIGIAFGFYGNKLYRRHADKKIKKIKETHGDLPRKENILKEKGGRRWYGPIFAALIFLSIYLVPTILLLEQQITMEDPIEAIQETEFYDYPDVTIAELFNTMFNEGEWELLETDEDYHIIAFTGIQDDNGFEQNVTIQFYNTAGTYESEVLFVAIEGIELDVDDSNSYLDDLFEAHESHESLFNPDS